MRSYFRLRTCINHKGEIEWTAIDAFARRHGITGRAFDWFEDAIYLLHAIACDAAAGKSGGGGSKVIGGTAARADRAKLIGEDDG